ncbi:uncharacterized protein METZ01_LOCUS356815 [marine metagenome]|uniref:Uncharacterized protein n=1 Tax=marine metagenome TaxID=408172 RepID=A0A382S508_9ZZZZ
MDERVVAQFGMERGDQHMVAACHHRILAVGS